MSRLSINIAGAGRFVGSGTGRACRVSALVVAILALSVLDLRLTLAYMSTSGFFEANPFVCLLVRSTNSATALILFKTGSAGFAGALLLWLRRAPQAELGAWCGLGALVWVMVQWHRYRLVDLSGVDSIPGAAEAMLRVGGL